MSKNIAKTSKKLNKVSKNLTKKQQLFVQEYLKDLNATDAYKRAGYAVKDDNVAAVCANKLLRNAKVKEQIDKAMEERAKRNQLSADWVLRKLKENTERCMQLEPVINKDGSFDGVYKWEPAAANRSLELIGKHIGMFVDRVEHSGSIDTKSKLQNISSEKLEEIFYILSEDEEHEESSS